MPPPPRLSKGSLFLNRYEVCGNLGEGGFGNVYRVTDRDDNQQYALKIENAKSRDALFKMEMQLLTEIPNKRHVCRLFDAGRVNSTNYMVMTLVDRNLHSIRKSMSTMRFSLGTVLQLGVQCLEAVQDVHEAGFVHRDVKPGNFAVGRFPNHRMVYIIDFGLARLYKKDGQVKRERFPVSFRGTRIYASMNAHFRRDCSPHDDICSLMFTLKELLSGKLPWQGYGTEMDIIALKANFTRKSTNDQEWIPFKAMYDKASRASYGENVDYDWFYEQFRASMAQNGVRDDQPYDWE